MTFVLLAALLQLVVLAYGFRTTSRHAEDTALARNGGTASVRADTLDRTIEELNRTAASVAATPGLAAFVAGDGKAACNLTAGPTGPLAEVRIDLVRSDGTVRCSSAVAAERAAPGLHGQSAWFLSALHQAATTQWNEHDALSGRSSVIVTARLTGGPTPGLVAILAPLASVADVMSSSDRGGGSHQSFTVVDTRSDEVVSSTETVSAGAPARSRHDRSGTWAGLDGTTRIYSSERPLGPLAVYVGTPRAEILSEARDEALSQGVLGVVGLLLLAFFAAMIDRKVGGPLVGATRAVIAGGSGGDIRVPESGTREMVVLAKEFNRMLDLRAGQDAKRAFHASHDPVTELPNRESFVALLDVELMSRGPELGLLKIGVSRFKSINDRYGRACGDQLLRDLGERLRNELEPSDRLARGEGDEFLILVTAAQDAPLVAVASKFIAAVSLPFAVAGDDVVLHCAAGAALCGNRPRPVLAAQLLREAASALASAQSRGLTWWQFDSTKQSDPGEDLHTEGALRQALVNDELVVHYQPLVDLATGGLVGAEALVRWERPGRGLLPPGEFLPVAEAAGLMGAIGEVVLRKACQQAAKWAAGYRSIRVSVNVHPRQLRDPDFPELVSTVLRETGLAPEFLCLELTESALIPGAGLEVSRLIALRDLGVSISIDDFGTGYSSLAYLHDLPATELKIDRSFTQRVGQDKQELELVSSIVRMARALGLEIVVEGVETQVQRDIMQRLGCKTAQGFWYSKAVTAGAFAAMFAMGDPMQSDAKGARGAA